MTGCDVITCVRTSREWVKGQCWNDCKCPLSVSGYKLRFQEPVGWCCQTRRQHPLNHITSATGAVLWGAEEAQCSQCSWPETVISDMGGVQCQCITENSAKSFWVWIYICHLWDVKGMQTKSRGCITTQLNIRGALRESTSPTLADISAHQRQNSWTCRQ